MGLLRVDLFLSLSNTEKHIYYYFYNVQSMVLKNRFAVALFISVAVMSSIENHIVHAEFKTQTGIVKERLNLYTVCFTT
jgi:hypothetical protein